MMGVGPDEKVVEDSGNSGSQAAIAAAAAACLSREGTHLELLGKILALTAAINSVTPSPSFVVDIPLSFVQRDS